MGERTHTTTVLIAARAGAVWPVMTDVERWPDWTESVSEVRRLDEGEFRVGCQARIRQPGLRPATWTVEALAPGTAFTWTTTAPGAHITATHRITPISEDSVEVALAVITSGPLAGLVDRLYGAKTQRYIEMEAAGLRGLCES